ncbi:hypothetical protein C8R30_101162 [Nitrosomonas nitrosa]|uniref:head-tail joining protein n=1 Tax=Nitrosomonas nitrosa TaxID=52442 RepID=UPI000D31C753|nr:hypothetical protein [Nitrosomonas nitrosa]PTR04965.1 hypothetical protein C8R30_101162 [Nitrosomonas nitrosa]
MLENLNLYFIDFGVDVEVGGVTLRGIFSNQYVDADGISSQVANLTVKSSDVELLELENGTELIFPNGDTYQIADSQPDGTGITILLLERKWKTYGLS